jgi:hypothetical protein
VNILDVEFAPPDAITEFVNYLVSTMLEVAGIPNKHFIDPAPLKKEMLRGKLKRWLDYHEFPYLEHMLEDVERLFVEKRITQKQLRSAVKPWVTDFEIREFVSYAYVVQMMGDVDDDNDGVGSKEEVIAHLSENRHEPTALTEFASNFKNKDSLIQMIDNSGIDASDGVITARFGWF